MSTLEKLRAKPDHVRRRIAFFASGILTLFIAVGWFQVRDGFAIPRLTAEINQENAAASIFSVVKDNASDALHLFSGKRTFSRNEETSIDPQVAAVEEAVNASEKPSYEETLSPEEEGYRESEERDDNDVKSVEPLSTTDKESEEEVELREEHVITTDSGVQIPIGRTRE